jgi:di/tricarboxylate transporter
VTFDQIITLVVLAAVIWALVFDKGRADVIALTGAAVLLISGVVRPVEVPGALRQSRDHRARLAVRHCLCDGAVGPARQRDQKMVALVPAGIGAAGIWLLIAICGAASAFPQQHADRGAERARWCATCANRCGCRPSATSSPCPTAAVLGGCCTLIGTSTNLLVDDMASISGQPRFGMFEITPVGVAVALAGGLICCCSAAG